MYLGLKIEVLVHPCLRDGDNRVGYGLVRIDVGDLLLLDNILQILDLGKLLNLNTSLVPDYQDSDVIEA